MASTGTIVRRGTGIVAQQAQRQSHGDDSSVVGHRGAKYDLADPI
jgi:hypothetical protein